MGKENLKYMYANLQKDNPQAAQIVAEQDFYNMITEDSSIVESLYGPNVSPNLKDYDDPDYVYSIASNLQDAGSKNATKFLNSYSKIYP